MKRITLVAACLMMLSNLISAKENDFTVSFGNGGIQNYQVIDNSCYVYLINYPKDEKNLSDIMNKVLFSTIAQAKKQFSKDNDGFINMDVKWQFIGKERLVYQICGDVVRRK